MKRMLDLLYAGGDPFNAWWVLPFKTLKKYFHATDTPTDRSHLTTMLLLIAVAEGERL